MKICIVGFPRSRSSLLLEAIGNHHGIPILGQDLEQIVSLPNIAPHSEQYMKLLAGILTKPVGVIRLHPAQLAYKKIICEFDLFNFEQYTHIYLTARRCIADAISSNLVARHLNMWNYNQDNPSLEFVEPIELTEQYHKDVKHYVYSEHIMAELQSYFLNKNIKFTQLYYEDIPEFVRDNLGNTDVSHVKTNYQYSTIIKNYNSIMQLYHIYKEQLQQLTLTQ